MKEFIKKIGINKNDEQQEYCIVSQGDYNSFEYNGVWLVLKSIVESDNYPSGIYEEIYFNPSQFITPDEPVVEFNLESYKENIESAVDELIDNTLKYYWYQSKGDIAINILDEDSIWREEATQLSKWVNSTYSVLRTYLDNVTEENHVDIQLFIDDLVKFDYP
jgi:hypothetical protein